eukprot:gene15425-biopygen5192
MLLAGNLWRTVDFAGEIWAGDHGVSWETVYFDGLRTGKTGKRDPSAEKCDLRAEECDMRAAKCDLSAEKCDAVHASVSLNSIVRSASGQRLLSFLLGATQNIYGDHIQVLDEAGHTSKKGCPSELLACRLSHNVRQDAGRVCM